jgi:hypothetical protein
MGVPLHQKPQRCAEEGRIAQEAGQLDRLRTQEREIDRRHD